MKNYRDKNTSIIKQNYDKRMDWVENNCSSYKGFPSNKEFKELNFLLERKYNDKIWWKLLHKESKKTLMWKVFHTGYDPYNISKEQTDMINIFKEKNPLTKEIRDYKIKIICD